MRNSIRIAWLLTAAIGASACGMLEPRLPEAAPAIPAEWPLPPTTPGTAPGAAGVATQASQAPQAAADIGWREFFTDPNLEELIAQALANNRDLRVAVLNVEKARAQYRIQRADRVPSIEATGAMYRAGGDGRTTESFSASVGVTDFELDLFGRVRNLSESAAATLFRAGGNATQCAAQPHCRSSERLPDARGGPGAVAPGAAPRSRPARSRMPSPRSDMSSAPCPASTSLSRARWWRARVRTPLAMRARSRRTPTR